MDKHKIADRLGAYTQAQAERQIRAKAYAIEHTGAQKLLEELLGFAVKLDKGNAVFMAESAELLSNAVRQRLDKHHMRYACDKLDVNDHYVMVDPKQADFFDNLKQAVIDKRYKKRKAELNGQGVSTGGWLDKNMHKHIEADVQSELWDKAHLPGI